MAEIFIFGPRGDQPPVMNNFVIELEVPEELALFKFPAALDQRLQELLDRQDRGETLSSAERNEAHGLVEMAELISLLKMRLEAAQLRIAP